MSIWTDTMEEEYQGWLVLGTILLDMYVFLFPFWLAGSGMHQFRRLATKIQRKYRVYFFFSCCFTFVSLGITLFFAPSWSLARIVHEGGEFLIWLGVRLPDFVWLAVVLLVVTILYQSQDKIKAVLGLEHVTVLKTNLRDVLTCWDMRRYRPIELFIWKAVDLPRGHVMRANDVFLEIHCGINEVVKTRVHHGAGSKAYIREACQFNFDPDDDSAEITIFVKSQGIVGAHTLGRVTLSNHDVMEQIQQWTGGAWHSTMFEWNNANMFEYDLKPEGQIWFRINPVETDPDEEADEMQAGAHKGSLLADCLNPIVVPDLSHPEHASANY